MTTLQTADKVLKDYYLGVLQEQMNKGMGVFYSMIDKTSEYVYGKDVKKIFSTGDKNYLSALDETADLPSSYEQEYETVTFPLKNFYAKIEISDKALRASGDNSGSVVNLLNAEMEGLLNSAKNEFGKMLFEGSGYTTAYVKETATLPGTLYLDSIDKIDYNGYYYVFSDDNELNSTLSRICVYSIDKKNNSIFVEESGTIKKGARLCTYDTSNIPKVYLTGLFDLFSDIPKVYGLHKSVTKWLYTNKKTIEREPTIDDVQTMLDEIENASGEAPNIIICSFETRRMLQKAFSENNVNTEPMVLDGGYRAISYCGIPIVVDKFCQNDCIYFLNTNYFKICQLCDWEWLADDDGKILKQIPNKAAYTATLVKYAELLCEKPRAQGRLRIKL